MTARQRGGLALALLAAALLSTGCAGDTETGTAPAPTGAAGLPPPTLEGLAPIIDPQVDDLDLRVTRAALVDAISRRPDPVGRHLALYVEPTGSWSYARYAESIAPLTRVLATSVFERWPGLESFDVCEEPPPGVDDRPEPETVATVELTRAASAAFDWPDADLATLAAAAEQLTPGVRLAVSRALRDDPAYQEAASAP